MKRSPQLVPLSREHHTALSLVRRVEKALEGEAAADLREISARVVAGFAADLAPHFAEEERWLLPTLSAAGEQLLVDRTLAEHARLRTLADGIGQGADDRLLQEFARLLRDHVRFEERELFAAFEDLQSDPKAWLL